MSYGTEEWAKWVLPEEKSLPLLKAAWEAGIQTWDTADIYSNVPAAFCLSRLIDIRGFRKYWLVRQSRSIIYLERNWLSSRNAMAWSPTIHIREDLPLMRARQRSTSTSMVRIPFDSVSNQQGLSRKHIFEAVDASLKRLGTDYIDVLQIHRYDYTTPP